MGEPIHVGKSASFLHSEAISASFSLYSVPSRPNSDRSLRPRRSRQSLRRTSQSCPKKSSSTASMHLPSRFSRSSVGAPTSTLRTPLIPNVLAAFFNTMWNKADPLHRKIKFVLLKGDYDPKAFVMVKTPGYCNAQLLAPMISPELCGKQMGIYHGDASVLLRTEIAGVLLMKTPEAKNQVVPRR